MALSTVNRPPAKQAVNRLTPELAQKLVGLETTAQWAALERFLDNEEKGVTACLVGLNRSAESHVWDRQVGEFRGVLLMIKLLRNLPADARLIVEAENAAV